MRCDINSFSLIANEVRVRFRLRPISVKETIGDPSCDLDRNIVRISEWATSEEQLAALTHELAHLVCWRWARHDGHRGPFYRWLKKMAVFIWGSPRAYPWHLDYVRLEQKWKAETRA